MPKLKFIDLFAGIGGFHHAFNDSTKFECVLASEIDSNARTVYELNFPGTITVGDIIPLTEPAVSPSIPAHDLLCAGFPCQPFSKSGKQLGLEETRGTLFYNIATILETRRPKYLLLENVRNLLGPSHRHTWALIIRTLRDIGYLVSDLPTVFSPHLLPQSMGGRPQVRDRVFIFGLYVGRERAWALADQNFNVPYAPAEGWSPQNWNLQDLPLEEGTSPQTAELSKSRNDALAAWEAFQQLVGNPHSERTLPGFPIWEPFLNDDAQEFDGLPDWKIDFIKKNQAFFTANKSSILEWRKRFPNIDKWEMSYRKFEWQAGDSNSFEECVIQFRPSGLRVKKATYLPALVAITQTPYLFKQRRHLSVREAARLQGFPDDFGFGGQPDSASYKQLGNAVCVTVVAYVFEQLKAQAEEIVSKASNS